MVLVVGVVVMVGEMLIVMVVMVVLVVEMMVTWEMVIIVGIVIIVVIVVIVVIVGIVVIVVTGAGFGFLKLHGKLRGRGIRRRPLTREGGGDPTGCRRSRTLGDGGDASA